MNERTIYDALYDLIAPAITRALDEGAQDPYEVDGTGNLTLEAIEEQERRERTGR